MKRKVLAPMFSALTLSMLLIGCGNGQQPGYGTDTTTKGEQASAKGEDVITPERLRRFDSLDFEFYTKQLWDSFAVSHDANIKVYYPDGKVTTGLYPQHIDMLKPMFVFAPDTRVTSHPVKFGSGDWTCVIGEVEGTFTKPMPTEGGKMIQPTGKKFKFSMCTVGHWKNGKMIEEYLFWDNLAIMQQLGIAK